MGGQRNFSLPVLLSANTQEVKTAAVQFRVVGSEFQGFRIRAGRVSGRTGFRDGGSGFGEDHFLEDHDSGRAVPRVCAQPVVVHILPQVCIWSNFNP